MPLATLDLSLEPATSQFIVSTRGALRLRLILHSSTELMATHTPTAIPLTVTDTVWPELLHTPEPPPPSSPGAPRDSARGALMLSQDTSPIPTPTASPQCP